MGICFGKAEGALIEMWAVPAQYSLRQESSRVATLLRSMNGPLTIG